MAMVVEEYDPEEKTKRSFWARQSQPTNLKKRLVRRAVVLPPTEACPIPCIEAVFGTLGNVMMASLQASLGLSRGNYKVSLNGAGADAITLNSDCFGFSSRKMTLFAPCVGSSFLDRHAFLTLVFSQYTCMSCVFIIICLAIHTR